MAYKSVLRRTEALADQYWAFMLALFFIAGFVLRAGPAISVPGVPYGGYDASYHFEMARVISEGGYPRHCVGCLDVKSYFKDYYYPPGLHTAAAMLKVLSGLELTQSIHLTVSFLDCMLVLTTFLLVRELYGNLPALVSAAVIALSYRNIQSLFWGQWPSYFGMAFIPLIILYGYRGLRTMRSMLVCGLFSGLGFAVYQQWALHAALVVFILHAANVRTSGFKSFMHKMAAYAGVFIIIALPAAYYMLDYAVGSEVAVKPSYDFGRLLQWYPPDTTDKLPYGYTREWLSIRVYKPLLLLLFALCLAGAILCKKDGRLAVPLANLIVFYVFAHLDVVGLSSIQRSVTEHHIEILVPALFIPCAFNVADKRLKDKIRLMALLLAAAYFVYEVYAMMPLTLSAYPRQTRISQAEIDAALWMKENARPDATIQYLGDVPEVTWKWFNALSDRRVVNVKKDGIFFEKRRLNASTPDYLIFDYNQAFLPPDERSQRAIMLRLLEQQVANVTHEVYRNDKISIKKTD